MPGLYRSIFVPFPFVELGWCHNRTCYHRYWRRCEERWWQILSNRLWKPRGFVQVQRAPIHRKHSTRRNRGIHHCVRLATRNVLLKLQQLPEEVHVWRDHGPARFDKFEGLFHIKALVRHDIRQADCGWTANPCLAVHQNFSSLVPNEICKMVETSRIIKNPENKVPSKLHTHFVNWKNCKERHPTLGYSESITTYSPPAWLSASILWIWYLGYIYRLLLTFRHIFPTVVATGHMQITSFFSNGLIILLNR